VLLRLSHPPSSPSLTEYADWVKPQIQIRVRHPCRNFHDLEGFI
jgi:hypothetical protein